MLFLAKKVLLLMLAALFASDIALSQDLPGKIRGYSVHREALDVALRGPNDPAIQRKAQLLITLDKPEFSTVGIGGARFAVTGQIETFGHEGSIDMVMFRDLTVNGIKVSVDDYTRGFRLRKKAPFRLTDPVIVNAGLFTLTRAAGKGLESEENWNISGTVLVFGKFKRLGFSFKRVIPIRIDAVIRNPLPN